MTALAVALLLTPLSPLAFGQEEDKPWQLPENLRASLDGRVQSFIDAQASGDWDRVASLLGRYRRGGDYLLYTPSHRDCLINEMKRLPLTEFNYTVWDKSFSSEILSTPLERRWWTLVGEGSFRQDSKKVTKQTFLTAYRDQGNWFFTPPDVDNDTAASHFTPEQLAADLRDQVVLRIDPQSPIDLADLHVFIDKTDVLSRHISFRIHNRTNKRITIYNFEISDSRHDGSTSVGAGAERDWIEPGGVSREWKENYRTNVYWCEGEAEIAIELQDVGFQDGTSWDAPKAPTSPK